MASLSIDIDSSKLTSEARKGYTVIQLKEFARHLNLNVSGTKAELVSRIKEKLKITPPSFTPFTPFPSLLAPPPSFSLLTPGFTFVPLSPSLRPSFPPSLPPSFPPPSTFTLSPSSSVLSLPEVVVKPVRLGYLERMLAILPQKIENVSFQLIEKNMELYVKQEDLIKRYGRSNVNAIAEYNLNEKEIKKIAAAKSLLDSEYPELLKLDITNPEILIEDRIFDAYMVPIKNLIHALNYANKILDSNYREDPDLYIIKTV